jgi:hypothetical protein
VKPPIEMPTSGASQQQYELQRVDYGAPEAGGRIGGVQAGFPLWMGSWGIGRIGADKSDELRAFWIRLRGATRRFIGRDLGRPYPKAHIRGFTTMTKADGSPFLGSASSWSETITGDGDSLVELNGVPPGLILSVGDYVGFRWTATEDSVAGLPWQAAVRVVEGAMADALGTVEVMCEPPVPTAIPAEAVAHLDRPGCVMAAVGDQSKLDPIDRRLAVTGGTIVGVQDIRS